MNQITFDDYIKHKSMEYANTCRHYTRNFCHISRKEPEQCPCENYEIWKSCFENDIPCTGQTKKSGDTVYEVQKLRKRIQPYEIIFVKIDRTGYRYYYWELKDGKGVYGNIKGFGDARLDVDVFLAREEAEAALKAMSE